ncbi:uncharacterized protein LOC106169322 [Lingula anatina]|uniref:Uncharacterized protein LOC106169322 n=1 Tax=Lingula anatina TaxID=7574 RepID=A0A1S3J2W0_LINAN|nr:uncharacterized protein LOC106169322 [Lingula anatina]|eukprot:XP_013404194.1 uncharacterized protein LOC106169322 [Lingula anatina]
MFSVSAISSCLGLSRQQLLEGVVAGKKGPVHKVYFTPGHLFVTVQDGHILYTFDVLPTSLPQALSRLGSLDIPSTADAIVDVLYIKKKPSLVIIVFANGAVDVWQFNLDNKFTWIKVGDFELLEGHDPEVKVISVTLHDLHNTIYWCERHGTGEAASFNICKKTLPPESEPVNRSTVGATVTILEGSPKCRLLPGRDCLIVWPECPGPQGLFFKWFHQTSTLQSHILPSGCVHTDDRVAQPVQYKDSVYRLLGIWCQTRDLPQIEGHMIHPVTKATHLLYHDGSTRIVCEEEGIYISGADP